MTLAFSAAPESLRRLAERAAKAVESKSKVPILSNVKIASTGDGRLELTGTDLDMTAVAISRPNEVEIERPGATTIPSQILRDFLKALGKVDRLRFDADDRTATMRVGGSTFELRTLPAADFPETRAPVEIARLALTAPQLRRIAACCQFAICTDEARYFLCGVNIHRDVEDPGRMVSVATDGHKLSLLRQPVEGDLSALPASTILPRKLVTMFDTIAEAAGDRPVAVALDERAIAFEAGDLRIVSRLIEGNFPDYRRVIPTGQTHRVEIERERLRDAVGRVATVREGRGAAMKFEFAAGALALSMSSAEANAGHDEIEIVGTDDLRIGFNSTYALAALESFDTHGLEIALGDPGSPALLRAPGDDSRLVVLMPMRV